jgi:hypothetical protein
MTRIRVHCHEIESIYNYYLEGRPFTIDPDKLKEANSIIRALSNSDFELVAFVERIVSNLNQTLQSIAKNSEPQEIQAFQTAFANDASNYIKKIEEQIDALRELRIAFLSLSGASVSI